MTRGKSYSKIKSLQMRDSITCSFSEQGHAKAAGWITAAINRYV